MRSLPFKASLILAGRFLAATVSGIFLVSCLFEEDKTQHPSLKKEDLVGCWRRLDIVEPRCLEECFDRDSLYYFKSNEGGSPAVIVEFSGSYRTEGRFLVGTSFSMQSTVNPTISRGTDLRKMTFIRDTLRLLDDRTEAPFKNFVRSDSGRNCGSRWMLFDKPPAWVGD